MKTFEVLKPFKLDGVQYDIGEVLILEESQHKIERIFTAAKMIEEL